MGAYKGVGPYGTYDMAGNVREWVANADDGGIAFHSGRVLEVAGIFL